MTKCILGGLFLGLALAGPASAIEAAGGKGGDQTPPPHLYGPQDPGNAAQDPKSSPVRAAVTFRGTIFPLRRNGHLQRPTTGRVRQNLHLLLG
jgi:hypothetical protein